MTAGCHVNLALCYPLSLLGNCFATVCPTCRLPRGGCGLNGRGVDDVIGQGSDWDSALNDVDWHDGDLLVVGSRESGPIARVYLGSRAAKIPAHPGACSACCPGRRHEVTRRAGTSVVCTVSARIDDPLSDVDQPRIAVL
jgi:hypothetical protein